AREDMTSVTLYDTTLRDGMQGEGMSLSAEEKVRVVHALDKLGVQLIEAGFLSSNPKDEELFALLEREDFAQAEIAAFGMTRGRGRGRRRRHALRHQRLVAPERGARGHRARGRRARRWGGGRHPHPRRRWLRRRELARRGRGRRAARPGHAERLRRALRQRQ